MLMFKHLFYTQHLWVNLHINNIKNEYKGRWMIAAWYKVPSDMKGCICHISGRYTVSYPRGRIDICVYPCTYSRGACLIILLACQMWVLPPPCQQPGRRLIPDPGQRSTPPPIGRPPHRIHNDSANERACLWSPEGAVILTNGRASLTRRQLALPPGPVNTLSDVTERN